MAQDAFGIRYSDLSGVILPVGLSERISFSLQGQEYVMDLTPAEAQEFKDVLHNYMRAAQKSGPAQPIRQLSQDVVDAEAAPATVRRWAREQGYVVGNSGRLPRWIVAAYHASVHCSGPPPDAAT